MATLPVEIRSLITDDVTSPHDRRSLRAVNKAWHAVATPPAFRSLHVRDRLSSAEGFAHLLEDAELAQHVREVVFQDSSADYEGDLNNNKWTARPNVNKTLRDAFSLIANLPNLSSLRLIFYPASEDYIEPIHDIPDELRIELAVLTGVAAASRGLALRSLTVLNLTGLVPASPDLALRLLTVFDLTSFPNDLFAQPPFHRLLAPLEHLRLGTKSVGSKSAKELGRGPFVEFWETVPKQLLPPAAALTTLALHSDDDVSIVPAFSFADLHYPRLAALSLQRIHFDASTRAEEFVVRHRDTLTRLELRGCRIPMEEFADAPDRYWSDVYDRLAEDLVRLTALVVEGRPYENPARPLRYSQLDSMYGPCSVDYMPTCDAAALESFRAVVASRRP